MCGLKRKVSGMGIRNWKYRLPITNFSSEEASATKVEEKYIQLSYVQKDGPRR